MKRTSYEKTFYAFLYSGGYLEGCKGWLPSQANKEKAPTSFTSDRLGWLVQSPRSHQPDSSTPELPYEDRAADGFLRWELLLLQSSTDALTKELDGLAHTNQSKAAELRQRLVYLKEDLQELDRRMSAGTEQKSALRARLAALNRRFYDISEAVNALEHSASYPP
jgi:hypothetical protein